MTTYAKLVKVSVSDHAMWRAAERFRGFDTVEIENEVREGLHAGRVTVDRSLLGLDPRSDPTCIYVHNGEGRVYAVRVDALDESSLVVTTTMRVDSARLAGATNRPGA